MNNDQKLPPALQQYLAEQKRKKKRDILLIIVVITAVSLGAIVTTINKVPKPDLKKNNIGNVTPHNDTVTPLTTDSISPEVSTTKPPNDAKPDLSSDEQRRMAGDAVAILDVYVKHNMNDPDSFEEISYDYSYHKTYFIIILKFRGKNSFGGKVINYIKAKTDLEGNVIRVLGNGD